MSYPARGRWRAVAIGFYAVLLGFLAWYLAGTDWSGLAALRWSPAFLLAALPLSLLPRLIQPLAWRLLIRGYGETPPPYPQLTRVYAVSWLGRYVPGKVAWIGAKVLFGRAYGISASTLAATALAEAAIQMMTALGLAFVIFAAAGQWAPLGPGVRLLAMVALGGMALLLAPPVFNALTSLVARRLGREDVLQAGRLRTRALVGALALYVLVHALSGLPIYLVIRAMYAGVAPASIPVLTAAFLLAGTMGTLALLAPSGLGVREGILLVLLGAMLPRPVAAAAVIALRLWSMAMDVVFYGLGELLDRSRPAPVTAPGTGRTPASG